MSLSQAHVPERPEGQATFEMANLRPKTTGLPFVVWVSQRDNIQHDLRVKVAHSARVIPSQMGVYTVRPFGYVSGHRLSAAEERLLENWISKNQNVLIAFWDAGIEYTEDMIEQITRV